MQLRFSQIHVTILNFVLIAALAIVSAMCVRDIIARSVANEADTPASSSARRAATRGTDAHLLRSDRQARHLQRDAAGERARAGPVEEDLNIKLIGTSILSRSKPYAIIEDPTGEESLYQVGEDIPDAGKLVSVETSRAIIDRGGHRVAIEIPSADMPEPSPSHLGNPAGAVHRPAGGFAAGMRERLRGLRGFRPNIPARGNDNSDEQQ